MKILVVDVGSTHVKILPTGQREHRQMDSGPKMTARRMVSVVKRLAAGWSYDHVAIGYPGPVVHGHPVAEPHNLGGGWVGFDFARAFGHPVKVINDAAMQALGSYRGGRMLFLGLGTGLGSILIGGGNARKLRKPPPGTRLGDNANAFVGGFRLWNGRPAPAARRG